MNFCSTRDSRVSASPMEAVLRGLASDGGLYMPEGKIAIDADVTNYAGRAAQILDAAFGSDYGRDTLYEMAAAAYAPGRFEDDAITPLRAVGPYSVLELFHGPTASFKDIALSMLPRLMAYARDHLAPEKEILVLTATSGDTGSATMAGFRNMPGIKVIVFYPHNGVSAVQAAQMQRMAGGNIKAIAIKGDFDQAQAGVKAIFRQADSMAQHLLLSSANSINIGRLIPQMVYYFDAFRQLGAQGQVVFAVPTGNFGDIFAGYLAELAGLPIVGLICATNANNVLHEALQNGVYDRRRELVKTLSPSMDILLSSNFERALYLSCERDSALCKTLMRTLEEEGRLALPLAVFHRLQRSFSSDVCMDAQALDVMRRVWREEGYLLDPHSAAAWHALQARQQAGALQGAGIMLSTASPYKFPAACLQALRIPVPETPEEQLRTLQSETGLPLPRALEGLFQRPILHQETIEVSAMADYVKEKALIW